METYWFDARRAGYLAVLDHLGVAGVQNWHRSLISTSASTRQRLEEGGVVSELFSSQYWPGESVCDHLAFALKYDGVNLALLSLIFETMDRAELVSYITSKPTGKYGRRLWFFYEFLTGIRLDMEDLETSNYVDALDRQQYYTIEGGERSARHRVVNNLLGPRSFCPVVRKTEKLAQCESIDLAARSEHSVQAFEKHLLHRALGFLYNTETKSSFAIEHVHPSASRTERFVALLEQAGREDFLSKQRLIALQNQIVDPRFMDTDYRTNQNYVGQSTARYDLIVHYITPKPEDLPSLMDGLVASHHRMKDGTLPPVIHAAVVSYGFVFLHPFEDGNGRIHRFLIHNILCLREAIPKPIMFPISAVLENNPAAYDASLEAFSKPLLRLLDYAVDRSGRMMVKTDSARWYRYMDLTAQAEALSAFLIETVEVELPNELNFLVAYDATKHALQAIVDMPDHLIDLFIRLCIRNNGVLSQRKRAAQFASLTDEELTAMESVIQDRYEYLSRKR